ncbi:MAG: hypothetical protein JWL84_5627 [Rhodospirillales bacterium]|jgi:hypothetical protein|nr:hypothetical protein [Rhodospirillales bacterium]
MWNLTPVNRELDPLAIHAALEQAVLVLGNFGQIFDDAEPDDGEQEGHGQTGKAHGETMIVLVALVLGHRPRPSPG